MLNYLKKGVKLAVVFMMVLVTFTIPNSVYAASGIVPVVDINAKSRKEIVATVVMPGELDTSAFSVKLKYDTDDLELLNTDFLESIYATSPSGKRVAGFVVSNDENPGEIAISCAALNALEKKSEGYTVIVSTFSLKDGKQLSDNSFKLGDWVISDVEGRKELASSDTHKGVINLECNHSETVTKVVAEASCDHKGKENVECAVCEHVLKTTEHEMLPHSFGEWKTAKPASCEEKGTEERKCSVCGKTETRETAALGHDYGEAVVTKEPTCTETGVKTQTCKKCGKEITEAIPTVDHKFGAWTTAKAATCEEKGTEERKCSVCGKTETRETAALGHDFGKAVVTKEPTCVEKGVKTQTCKHCGKEITEEIPATGHKFGEWKVTKEATETEEGSKERECTVCGEKEVMAIAKKEATPTTPVTPDKPATKPTDNKTNQTTNNKNNSAKKDNTVKTGDDTNELVYGLCASESIVLAAFLYVVGKRREILNK